MYFRNGINHIIYIICAVSEPVLYQVEKGRRTNAYFLSFLSFPSILEKTLPPLLNFKMYCKVECTRRIGSMRIEKCSLRSSCITTSELGWVFKLRVPKEKEGEGFERDDAGIYILLVKKNSFSRNWSLSLFPSSLVFDARRWGLSSRLLVFFCRRMKGCPPSHSFDYWKLYPFLLLLLLVKRARDMRLSTIFVALATIVLVDATLARQHTPTWKRVNDHHYRRRRYVNF